MLLWTPLPQRALLLVAALFLDLILGDPEVRFHPVRLIGDLAGGVERLLWRRDGRVRGILAVALVLAAVTLAGEGLLRLAAGISPLLLLPLEVLLLKSTMAPRSLGGAALQVRRALAGGDLPAARQAVSRLVGRDTHSLPMPQVVRATIESVAENSMDGILAPLLYATAFGLLGALLYRAVNTLDSMWGHKNARYTRFGWAAARLDDLLGYLPARLSGLLLALAAVPARGSLRGALRTLRRDGRRHPSPNAGLSEAAMAGALGVRLGGPSRYQGVVEIRPYLGEAKRPLLPQEIDRAVRHMAFATLLALALGLGVLGLWEGGL